VAGDSQEVISVPLLDDSLVEGDEVFEVVLSNPGGGAVLGDLKRSIVTITDDTETITYVNPAIERILGIPREAILGQGIFDFVDRGAVDPGAHDAELRDITATVLAGDRWEGEYEVRTQDGRRFRLESTITPVRDTSGRVTMTLGIHRDVTHVRQLEARLTEAARLESIGQLAVAWRTTSTTSSRGSWAASTSPAGASRTPRPPRGRSPRASAPPSGRCSWSGNFWISPGAPPRSSGR